ncbi:MAG: iron ABC transporter [Gemmobacter sp.]
MPQAATLAFPFTVAEVVRLSLTSGQHAARNDLIALAMDEVDLPSFGSSLYQELSGKQQARVQRARVRVQVWTPVEAGSPRWLVLDEPVASLDIAHQIAVMRILRRFADSGGGVVLVLHDLNLAEMVADTVWLMRDGRILREGPAAEVIGGPALAQACNCALQANRMPPPRAAFVLPQV